MTPPRSMAFHSSLYDWPAAAWATTDALDRAEDAVREFRINSHACSSARHSRMGALAYKATEWAELAIKKGPRGDVG